MIIQWPAARRANVVIAATVIDKRLSVLSHRVVAVAAALKPTLASALADALCFEAIADLGASANQLGAGVLSRAEDVGHLPATPNLDALMLFNRVDDLLIELAVARDARHRPQLLQVTEVDALAERFL